MIGIFKQKNPANILLLLLFGVSIKVPMFLNPHVMNIHEEDSILYKAILNFLEPYGKNFPAVYPLIAFGLLFLQAIMLTRFINDQRMVNWPGYLPGMAYLLITSLFPEWNYLSAPLIVNTILLFVLSGLLKIYNQQNAKGTIYNMGLALGIASFLFFPSITFIIWVLLALLVMRPFRLNEWMICIVGMTTPFYFYAIYLFIKGQWNWQHLWPYFTVSLPVVKQSAWLAGSAFLLVVPFLAGGYYVQENLRRMLIQVRKGWSLLLLYLLGAIFVPFVNSSGTFENWVMCTIPFAAFHACTYLYSNLRIFPLLLFWLTVAFVLGYQYYGPGW
ncbi:MAG TPA: hypothetical protein VKC90_06205 [Chitinophagaceae bacterium]|nr:hypothetical protein [Chitinophagaceae bacterium]